MEENYKIVDFSKCATCKFITRKEIDEPCHSCLNIPARYGSTTPEYYKKREGVARVRKMIKGKKK